MHGLQSRLSQTLRLALLDRLSHELNADLSSSEVLRRVLNAAAEALGTPYASIIALKDRQLLAAYALGGGDRDPLPSIQRVLKDGLAGFVMYNYRTIIVNDITSNPLWLSLPGDPLSPQVGSALCVPLTHAGDMVGVMTLAHPATSYFTADAVSLTAMIGEMGAAALSSALLLEAAREAEKRYATLFDDVIVPIIVTDLQGQIRAVNRRACEFLGYSRDELLRLSILAVHRMGTGPLGKDRFENLAHGREEHFQSKVWTKDGGERVVHVYAKCVHSAAEGDSIQWIEHDISSQLTLERLRQDLSAMMYHDMRGPLGNVYSSLQALQRLLGENVDTNVQALLQIAARSERQVRRMIDSLLDIQRLEEGKKLLNRANTGLNQLIHNAAEQVKPQADDNRIQVRFALTDELPALYIDQDMIERVIINLLDNAIKYSPPGGAITLSTASSNGEVYVRVKDSGPGIPPEAQQLIFDKFARVKQRNMPHGVGLGLAFCKLAVEAHGGRIWVRSNGVGSTFTIALPVQAPATHELPPLGASGS
jgi:two-component system, NtrC family, sensor histidine kinase KinB